MNRSLVFGEQGPFDSPRLSQRNILTEACPGAGGKGWVADTMLRAEVH